MEAHVECGVVEKYYFVREEPMIQRKLEDLKEKLEKQREKRGIPGELNGFQRIRPAVHTRKSANPSFDKSFRLVPTLHGSSQGTNTR